MIYRLIGNDRIVITHNGADVFLEPGKVYDDDDPEAAELVRAHPGFFEAPNVEAATAAPGERRSTRRKPV